MHFWHPSAIRQPDCNAASPFDRRQHVGRKLEGTLSRGPCEGDLELVRYNVKCGVDINYAHSEILATPLVACLLAGQGEVAQFLLDSGANPHLLSEFDGLTPIQATRQAGLPAVAQRLRELGVREPAAKPQPVLKSWSLILVWGRRAA